MSLSTQEVNLLSHSLLRERFTLFLTLRPDLFFRNTKKFSEMQFFADEDNMKKKRACSARVKKNLGVWGGTSLNMRFFCE